MGTSALTNVFPEAVARGLRRWQRRAKKKVARKHNYWPPPSLDDASVDYSLASLSFSTLDASLSELGLTADDELFTSVEIEDEGSDAAARQMEKMGSFEGFDSGRNTVFRFLTLSSER